MTAEADTRGPWQEPGGGGGADPMRLVIRDRTPEDMRACIAALAAVHAHDAFPLVWPPDPAAWLTPPNLRRAWVAYTATGELAGHVVLRADPDRPDERAEVSRLFVHPELRRHGAAQQLVETCRAWALESGRALMLEVTAVGERTGAMRFYEAMGWRYVETRQASWTSATGEPVQLHEYRLDP